MADDSKTVRDLAEINHRYEALRATLSDREEDLDLNSKLAEKTNSVGGLMDWVTATDAKVVNAAPRGGDMGQLTDELENYKVGQEYILQKFLQNLVLLPGVKRRTTRQFKRYIGLVL